MPPPLSVRRRLHSLRRAVLARRRPLAALLVALAVLVGLRTTVGPGPPTVEVPVASRDLAAGERLVADDVSQVSWPAELAPAGLTAAVAGQVLAAPLRRGEPAVVELLQVGDRLDLSAVDPETGDVAALAEGVLVLAIPPAGSADSQLTGRLIVAGITPERAQSVSAATLTEFLTVTYSR